MTLLVLRPDQQGEALCDQLNLLEIPAIHHSLVRYNEGRGCPGLPSLMEKSRFVIAVSRQAVEFSHQYLMKHGHRWPEEVRYLAIGQKTAQLLSNFTQQSVNYPEISDSEHFLQLPELQNPADISIVIIRGNSGRELIAQELTRQGARVTYCEVYQREMIPFDAKTLIQKWHQIQVKQIVVTSENLLNFFVSQIPEKHHSWLFGCTLYVPGKRIEKLARDTGFTSIVVVGSASNSDLVAALQPQKE